MVAHHQIALTGASFAGGPGPVVLERTDEDFIETILANLATADGRRAVADTAMKGPSGGNVALKVFQPVHRTFHVVLVEAWCDTVGHPRLDPARIDSAGMVIRRVAQGGHQGWLQAGRKLRAWATLSEAAARQDPDPQRRPATVTAGHPEIDRRLALLRAASGGEPLAESASALFVAPPEVCRALNRTLLYGVVPAASPELEGAPASLPLDDVLLQKHLPRYFIEAAYTRAVPRAGATLTVAAANDSTMQDYIGFLSQVAYEFEAFSGTAAGNAVLNALNQIALPFAAGGGEVTRPAGNELRQAWALLVDRTGSSIVMPLRWPAVSAAVAAALAAAVRGALTSRFATARQLGIVSGAGRYEDLAALYELRAFVRVKSDHGCPPVLCWSPYSAPFRIAPWYDSNAAAAPVKVLLPDIADVSKLKPNVTFQVPENVFNVLQRNKDVKDFGKPGSPSIGIDWLCSFSLPSITLCAFIVLNIFLQLFDLIFSWMFFIKICIPIPKRK